MMNIILGREEVDEPSFPENKIRLLDGTLLDCYPLEQPMPYVSNALQIDDSGSFFTVGRKPNTPKSIEAEESEREKVDLQLFLDNAFLFTENRERILSDSRMFLCPLPIRNGLYYTGESGFRQPTLGIYLEWWLNTPKANIIDENGEKWLVWRIVGSPMSGSNKCSMVNPKGESKREEVSGFIKLWPSFRRINCRYDMAKLYYQAYNIEQVLGILQKEGRNVVYDNNIYIGLLEQSNSNLKKELNKTKSFAKHLYNRLHKSLMSAKVEELKQLVDDVDEQNKQDERRLLEIRGQKAILRKRLKSGEITNIEYQKLWSPLSKEKEYLQHGALRYAQERLKEYFPEDNITLLEVREFVNKQRNE